MVNMFIFYNFTYFFGFENRQHVDVLACVVLLEFKDGQNDTFYKFTYYFEFANGQHVDVLVFEIVFGICELSEC